MTDSFRTIRWTFRDAPSRYPPKPRQLLQLGSPDEVFKHFRFLFSGQVRERFVVIWIDSSNHGVGYEVVTEGTLNCSLVHPREVFRGAIVATCASIVLAHNHPSGVSTPSAEDLTITHQLVETGIIIGIPVLDHIIFTDTDYLSFAAQGLMQPQKGDVTCQQQRTNSN